MLAVVIGGLIPLAGSFLQARGAVSAAAKTGDAAREVATLEQQTAEFELRLKKAELLFDEQLASACTFLGKLSQWDLWIKSIDVLPNVEGHSLDSDDINNEQWEVSALVQQMYLVFPHQVTQAADSTMEAGLQALDAHLENYHVGDKAIRVNTEAHRIRSLDQLASAKKHFLNRVQEVVHGDVHTPQGS
jgi:hypothetical protein